MRIVVCIKQVPSTSDISMNPETNTIIRSARQSVINPFDTHAVEQAVLIKEQLGGEVIALSMGILSVKRLLRDAAARGVDKCMLLSDKKFAGADTLATAYTLSLGIKQIGKVDLILCGKMAVDGDTAQIGPELAEHLDIPHVTDVSKIEQINEQELICEKLTDTGYQRLKVKLPALITVLKDINLPRLPSIPGVLYSQSAQICIKDAHALNADPNQIGLTGSPTQVVKTYTVKKAGSAISVEGDAQKQAEFISALIDEVLK